MNAPSYWPAEAIRQRAQLPLLMKELRKVLEDDVPVEVPPRFLSLRENPFRAFGVMPALSEAHGLFVTKVASIVGDRSATETPSVQAWVLAFSTNTGAPVALLDGAELTALKTAAVTALVTDRCARQDARSLAVIGSGVQAFEQVRAVLEVRPVRDLRVFSRLTSNVDRFLSRVQSELGFSGEMTRSLSADAAVDGADIVSTATTSVSPVLTRATLPAKTHVNCMGAHRPGSRELPPELLTSGTLIVEDLSTAVRELGDSHLGALDLKDMLREKPADLRQRLTIFSSTGHGLLDLVTAAHILKEELG